MEKYRIEFEVIGSYNETIENTNDLLTEEELQDCLNEWLVDENGVTTVLNCRMLLIDNETDEKLVIVYPDYSAI